MPRSGATAKHAKVQELAAELRLGPSDYERAMEVAGLLPQHADWVRGINHFLMAIGTLLIAAGIATFIAWNWADLGHFEKFAMIQGGIVAAVVLTAWLGMDSIGGRAAFVAAAFLTGVLLALFGQVYQTGADPYGLFLAWALLITPWVLVGRQAALWMMLLVLLNLAIILYWTQVVYPPPGRWDLTQTLGPIFWLTMTVTKSGLAVSVFALNLLALVIWEFVDNGRVKWLAGRWFPRLLALGALFTLVASTLTFIVARGISRESALASLPPLLLLISLAAAIYYYQQHKPDLLILTVCALSIIVVFTTFVIKTIANDLGSFLLIAILVVGQVAGAAYWLRQVAQSWETAE